ncbi:MAG: hypothetical protein ACREF3_15905, partial [Acetobacteraceae bacterium]
VLAYANGFTLWHYKTGADPLEAIRCSGFFADAADMLAGGDIMMVSAHDRASILCIAATERGEVEALPLT